MYQGKKRRTLAAITLAIVATVALAVPVVMLTPGCGILGPTPTIEDVDTGRLEVKDSVTGEDRPATIDDLIADLTARLEKVDAALGKLERAAEAATAVTAKVGDAVPGPVGDAADLTGWVLALIGAGGTATLARQKAKLQEELARAVARKAADVAVAA